VTTLMPANLQEVRDQFLWDTSSAEHRFKRACKAVLLLGYKPTPKILAYVTAKQGATLEVQRGRRGGVNLNGRETAWRREVLEEAGWTKTYNGSGHGRWERGEA